MKKFLLTCTVILCSGLVFGQDLMIESASTKSSFHRHDQFTAEVTVKNVEILPTGPAYGVFYLTTNIDSTQSSVGIFNIPALAANQTFTYTENIYSPIVLGKGLYTLVIKIGDNNFEVNLDNNRFIGPEVEILPSTADLFITSANPSFTTLAKGSLLKINVAVTNSGSPVKVSYVDAYLSDDGIVDAGDIKLALTNSIYVKYKSDFSGEIEFSIPYNQALGDYHIILNLIESGYIDEVGEDNDQYIIGGISVIDSDIQLSIEYGSTNNDSYDNHETIHLQFAVKNSGTTGSATQNIEIYSSYDGSTEDMLLSSFAFNYATIEPGGTGSFYQNVDIYDGRDFNYIIVKNDDPDYPLIAPYTFTLTEYTPPDWEQEH